MKISHELCNDFFKKLDIDTKRYIFNILAELHNAESKHPAWPKDIIHGAAIVGEESGELLQAALQYCLENGQYYAIHKEAIQTGAMCLRLLKNLPKKKLPGEMKDSEPKYQR